MHEKPITLNLLHHFAESDLLHFGDRGWRCTVF